jgi:hypothetical protein
MSKIIETLFVRKKIITARAHKCSQERGKEKNASRRHGPSFVYLRERFIYREHKKTILKGHIATAKSLLELFPEVRNAG